MVLTPSLYSSQFPWRYSDYPYIHNSLPGGTQTIPVLITVYLVAHRLSLYSSQSTWWLRQSLYSSQSPWWYSDYPYTHHSLPGDTPTISSLITVSLVVLRLSLCSSQSPLWSSVYPYTYHSHPGGPQYITIHIPVSLVVLRLSLYASQSLWWYSEYPCTHHSLPGGTQTIPHTHHSLPGGTQTIPILITVSLVVVRLSHTHHSLLVVLRLSLQTSQSPMLVPRVSLYSSQSPCWNLGYPYTHLSLPRGTQTIPMLITVSLAVLRLSLHTLQSPWWWVSLYSSQSPWLDSDYPYTHHSVPGDMQTIPLLITVSLVVLRLLW